jgi:hypothetical protein
VEYHKNPDIRIFLNLCNQISGAEGSSVFLAKEYIHIMSAQTVFSLSNPLVGSSVGCLIH